MSKKRKNKPAVNDNIGIRWPDQADDIEISRDAFVSPSAVLKPHIKILNGAKIGPNCTLEKALIGQKTVISEDCTVTMAQIGDYALILPKSRLVKCLIGHMSTVGRDCVLEGVHTFEPTLFGDGCVIRPVSGVESTAGIKVAGPLPIDKIGGGIIVEYGEGEKIFGTALVGRVSAVFVVDTDGAARIHAAYKGRNTVVNLVKNRERLVSMLYEALSGLADGEEGKEGIKVSDAVLVAESALRVYEAEEESDEEG